MANHGLFKVKMRLSSQTAICVNIIAFFKLSNFTPDGQLFVDLAPDSHKSSRIFAKSGETCFQPTILIVGEEVRLI